MSQSESLVKRLAGPSTGKAGVKQDQEEINRIIAEASKGSKFYENEKRKDKELTEKIEKLLKMRDELLKAADIHKLEIAADKMLEELESARDLSQAIVHVDLDSFYASVEILDNPDLAGKPFGVGYGVLSTASYEARKYGVRSAMPGFIAKKLCPELIFVSSHFDRYIEMSRQVMEILKFYDPHMATGGMDEAYLNITEYCKEHNIEPIDCVTKIRAHVFEETKLTISAGLAPNTMLAKICSDRNKPNGQYHLPSEKQAVLDFTKTLSIRKIPGIGRITERLLDSIGIKTCGDVYTYRAVVSLMDHHFHLRFLLKCYLGLGSTTVEPGKREERKSVGVETTFNPLSDEKKILEKLSGVATDLEEDLERTGWAARTITLKYKLDTYQVFTRAKSAPKWVTKKENLFEIGKELLMAEMPLKLRLIGLRATRLKDLRADPDKGIKRFFNNQASTSNKRQKLANDDDDDEIEEISFPQEGDEVEEHRGDFQMHDGDDGETEPMEKHEGEEAAVTPPVSASGSTHETPHRWTRKDPPNSKTSLANSATLKAAPKQTRLNPVKVVHKENDHKPPPPPKSKPPHALKRPVSVERAVQPVHGASAQKLTCPICASALETDNAGLNAHVDWCLSRGEIKRASAG